MVVISIVPTVKNGEDGRTRTSTSCPYSVKNYFKLLTCKQEVRCKRLTYERPYDRVMVLSGGTVLTLRSIVDFPRLEDCPKFRFSSLGGQLYEF